MVNEPFPKSIMTASNDEIEIILNVTEGKLPKEVCGHVFMVAPVGSVNSNGLPNPSGAHIWNGDGMIYRLDFARPGRVKLTTRLVKSPCYYADKATVDNTTYQFRDYGMARFSLPLGMRNQLNTAFLPMQFSPEQPERLLITFDGGRHYEIDPVTLKIETPVGANMEWRPAFNLPLVFQPVLSTAHPVFDPHTGQLFTVNYGRSFSNFSETIPLRSSLEKKVDLLKNLIRKPLGLELDWSELLDNLLLEDISGADDFVYLIRWDGSGDLERWKLVLSDGSPVKIQQTMHQIAASRDYVILIDSCLKFGLGQLLNSRNPNNLETIKKLVGKFEKKLVSKAQLPDTTLYIVRRKDLRNGQHPSQNQPEVEVVAQKLVIPLETAHFLVDYDNPENHITLHMAHECAADVSEWLQHHDQSVYPLGGGISHDLAGMLAVGAMDVGRLGRYVIDVEQAKVIESKVIHRTDCTWALSLYTYRDRLPSGLLPKKITNLYWHSFGFWPELFTQFIFDLYKNYPYRIMSVEQVLNLKDGQSPRPCLFRLETTKMEIADIYEFPQGHIINSPQFIPKTVSKTEVQQASSNHDLSTSGYIICAVVSSKSKEFWFFDAQDLSSGPVCKLGHDQLNFGYTVHTAWLPKIERRAASYQIPVRSDYEELVKKKKSEKVKKLFEDEVYPHFPENRENL
ncbi:MAG: carotenoid oxygenase family protein [Prochloraceae cyanobacterium]|nr:carotenoid oxygenase family protein [Prochloraceae cyanobacterium]